MAGYALLPKLSTQVHQEIPVGFVGVIAERKLLSMGGLFEVAARKAAAAYKKSFSANALALTAIVGMETTDPDCTEFGVL